MKRMLGVSVVVVLVLMSAGSAEAGLQFASSFSDPGLSASTVTTSSGGGVDPAGLVTVTASGSGPFTGVLDYLFSPPADFRSPTGVPDVVIWFGTISAPILLTGVGISEDSGSTFTTQSFADIIGTGYSEAAYGIFLSTGAGGIPLVDRDEGTTVRLSFSLTTLGDSFTIDGVSTPEPGSLALFGLGLALMAGGVYRRRRKATRS